MSERRARGRRRGNAQSIAANNADDNKQQEENESRANQLRLEREVKELRKQLKKSVSIGEFEELKKENGELFMQTIEFESQIKQLQDTLASNESELGESKEKILSMESQSQRSKKEFNNKLSLMEESLSDSQLETDALKKENSRMRTTMAQQSQSVQTANEGKMEELQLTIETYRQQIDSLKSQMHQQLNLVQEWKDRYAELKTKHKTTAINASLSNDKINDKLDVVRAEHGMEMQNLKRIHASEVKEMQNTVDKLRKRISDFTQGGTDETGKLNAQLQELQETHETIENDLEEQLSQMRAMMVQREKDNQSVIDELNIQWNRYKLMAESEIQTLKQRMVDFEDGQVEIMLSIDVDGTMLSSRPCAQIDAPSLQHKMKNNPIPFERANTYSGLPGLNHHTLSQTLSDDVSVSSVPRRTPPPPLKPHTSAPPLSIQTSAPLLNQDALRQHTQLLTPVSPVGGGGPKSYDQLSDAAKKAADRKIQHQRSATTRSQTRSTNLNSKYNYYGLSPRAGGGGGPVTLRAPSRTAGPSYRMSSPNVLQINTAVATTGGGQASADDAADWSSDLMNKFKKKILGSFTPSASSHHLRNGFPDKPYSVRSAGSAYSVTSPSDRESQISGSDIDRYVAMGEGKSKLQLLMYQKDNAKLAENLKLAHQKLMLVKEQEHSKNKQLQLSLEAERAHYTSKETQHKQMLVSMEERMEENEKILREKIEALHQVQSQFKILQSQLDVSNEQMKTAASWQQSQSNTNRSLMQHIEDQRQQIMAARTQLQQSQYSIQSLQSEITTLNKKLAVANTANATISNISSKNKKRDDDAASNQTIKVLKTQRRVLIREIKDLREQNEKLKSMVVSTSVHGSPRPALDQDQTSLGNVFGQILP